MEIVIYNCRQVRTRAAKPSLAILFRQFGYNLLFLALMGFLYAASPFLLKEAQYRLAPKLKESPARATFSQILRDEEISLRSLAEAEAKKYGVTTDFSIVIPKISAKAKVVPNVHPGIKNEYMTALKEGVAHASGTGFPGGNSQIFLFSHSVGTGGNVERYNAVFYQLKELEQGDKIIIFYAGKKFSYKVTEKLITKADDTGWLTEEEEGEKLILQTCWPPGTSLKRLIVLAKPI